MSLAQKSDGDGVGVRASSRKTTKGRAASGARGPVRRAVPASADASPANVSAAGASPVGDSVVATAATVAATLETAPATKPLIDRAVPNGEIPSPFEMPVVELPKFPARVIDITKHGAVGDGQFDCTTAIADAIAQCAKAGGGRVLIPAGNWFTGAIHLRSNIDLHLARGATLIFSDDPTKYLPPVFVRWNGLECRNYSPLIYACDCDNIAITGAGVILGRGKAWWAWEKRQQRVLSKLYSMALQGTPVEERIFGCAEMPLRPQLISPINCTRMLIEDITIGEGGPCWTVHLAYCADVTIRRVRIIAPDGPNNDGIVIDSSRNVVVEDCDLHCSEDCVSLKSGMNEEGQRLGRPTENVIVRRIRATAGRGGINIGSDMSGGVRNVFVHDCHFDGPSSGIRMKAARGRGGVVQDIVIQDITMGRIPGEAIQFTTEFPSFVLPYGKAPTFRNILIKNVTCAHASTAVKMIGLSDNPLQSVTLENVTIAADEGLYCASGNHIRLVNVNITPRFGPVLAIKDSQEVLIHGLHNAQGASVFLDLRGRQTRNIRLQGEAKDHMRPAVVLGVDVPRDALVHE